MYINAARFKANCLKLIDQVATTRKPLIITKRGKPLAKLVPIQDEKRTPLFGYMKGTAEILGDIVNVPHDAWAAETGEEDDLYVATPQKKKAPKKKAPKKKAPKKKAPKKKAPKKKAAK